MTMNTSLLLGTAFSVLLIASPGLALAQNNGNGGYGTTNGRITGGLNGDYSNQGAGGNQMMGRGNMNNEGAGFGYNSRNGFRPYEDIGLGGYNGLPLPIRTGNNGNGNSNNNGNNNNNYRPSQRNPLLSDNGDVRAGKMIGTAVYNDQNNKLGSISDILIGRNGVWAIVSANNHKVAVPFRDFVFGDSNIKGDDKLVLPNATEAQLDSMPVFHYNVTNYANNNGGNNGLFGNNGGAFRGNNVNNWNGNNHG
jgi:hypothetical protein